MFMSAGTRGSTPSGDWLDGMLRSYQRQEDRAAQRNASEEQRVHADTAAVQRRWLRALRHAMFPDNAAAGAVAAPGHHLTPFERLERFNGRGPVEPAAQPASGGPQDNSASEDGAGIDGGDRGKGRVFVPPSPPHIAPWLARLAAGGVDLRPAAHHTRPQLGSRVAAPALHALMYRIYRIEPGLFNLIQSFAEDRRESTSERCATLLCGAVESGKVRSRAVHLGRQDKVRPRGFGPQPTNARARLTRHCGGCLGGCLAHRCVDPVCHTGKRRECCRGPPRSSRYLTAEVVEGLIIRENNLLVTEEPRRADAGGIVETVV